MRMWFKFMGTKNICMKFRHGMFQSHIEERRGRILLEAERELLNYS